MQRRTESEAAILQQESAHMAHDAELLLPYEIAIDDDTIPAAPSPLLGIVAGVLLSLALWLLIGCIALVLRLLGVG